MRGEYTILIAGIIIFLIESIKYHPSRLIQLESYCDSEKKICVHCPKLKSSPNLETFYDIDSAIIHNSSFRVLVCSKQFSFKRQSCERYLQLVDQNLYLDKNNQIIQNQIEKNIFYEQSQQEAIFLTQNYYFLQQNQDYIIYTKGKDKQKPKVNKQSQKNAEGLYFYAKVINQSALIALTIASIMSIIGFSCFLFQKNRIPFLQILVLSASFITLKNHQLFQYSNLTKAIFLLVLSTKISNKYNHFKIITICWLIVCFFLPKSIIIGYYYIFHCIRKAKKSQLNSILSIIFGIFFSLQLLSIIPLSFFSFICILWEVIFLPILLITFQDETTTGINDSFQ